MLVLSSTCCQQVTVTAVNNAVLLLLHAAAASGRHTCTVFGVSHNVDWELASSSTISELHERRTVKLCGPLSNRNLVRAAATSRGATAAGDCILDFHIRCQSIAVTGVQPSCVHTKTVPNHT